MSDKLSHFNARGEAHMVDVGDKDVTERVAVAEGTIRMQAETVQQMRRSLFPDEPRLSGAVDNTEARFCTPPVVSEYYRGSTFGR